MGPDLLSEATVASQKYDQSPIHPPKLITGVPSKVGYRDNLPRWNRLIDGCADVDKKQKAKLRSSGHLIYMACDDIAQEPQNKRNEMET